MVSGRGLTGGEVGRSEYSWINRPVSRLDLIGGSCTSKELAEGPGAQLGNLRLLHEEIREVS